MEYLKTLVGNQLIHVTETRQTSDQTYKKSNKRVIKQTNKTFVLFRAGFSLRKHLVRIHPFLLS